MEDEEEARQEEEGVGLNAWRRSAARGSPAAGVRECEPDPSPAAPRQE